MLYSISTNTYFQNTTDRRANTLMLSSSQACSNSGKYTAIHTMPTNAFKYEIRIRSSVPIFRMPAQLDDC